MSSTEIFGFNNRGNAYLYGSVQNSWRGGRAIWSIMEERHLPPYRPPYVSEYAMGSGVKHYSRTIDGMIYGEEPLKEIWNLVDNEDIPIHERIALATTLSNVIVLKKDIPQLIEAFNAFGGNTSLPEQVKILQAMYEDKKCIAVGWNQTSVNCDTWENLGRDKRGRCKRYNIKTGDKHWVLFDEIKQNSTGGQNE